MRAVRVHEFGAPDVLQVEDLPDPAPDPGQVVIETAYADVMFLDVRLRSGWGRDYFQVTVPYVPGGGVGGTVTAVGDGVDAALLGTVVTARVGGVLPVGGYAEQAVADADALTPVPAEVDLAAATAMVHDGRTAIAAYDAAAVQPGELVVVTAASGGLGTLLTQLSVRAGANVVAVVGNSDKADMLHRLGAQVTLNAATPGWAEQLPDRPQVVFDGAGGAVGTDAARLLGAGGRFLPYGAASGEFADADGSPAQIIDLRQLNAAGAIDWAKISRRALELVGSGGITVVIGQTFPLEDAVDAHTVIEQRRATGRTLLVC
ncbi:zinc-binding dehydrogenase [Flexivirga meconopsidis]|uniref:zinc-binding dehydrogenase n=1 Tax=Flexivirga meconopsidis TaxID=2977121 RepID=UPI00223F5E6C|nr:zinc-binding dehydrogenase [Flexivirga meconopsidis]